MPRVGFEPTISAGEQPKTYALDRAATGTGAAGRIMSMKYSSDTIGNRTATFRLLAQCLNQLRHRVPQMAHLKGKVVAGRARKAYRGSRSIAPHILNHGTRWRRVVSFTPRPLNLGKEPWYPLNWVEPRAVVDVLGKRRRHNFPRFEPLTIKCNGPSKDDLLLVVISANIEACSASCRSKTRIMGSTSA